MTIQSNITGTHWLSEFSMVIITVMTILVEHQVGMQNVSLPSGHTIQKELKIELLASLLDDQHYGDRTKKMRL